MQRKHYATVAAYMKDLPKQTKPVLQKLWTIVKQAAPKTEETISYNIPCLKLNGKFVVYAAGLPNHVSIYPVPRADAGLKSKLSKYQFGKGTLRFALDKPLPAGLIKQVVRQLVKDNIARRKK